MLVGSARKHTKFLVNTENKISDDLILAGRIPKIFPKAYLKKGPFVPPLNLVESSVLILDLAEKRLEEKWNRRKIRCRTNKVQSVEIQKKDKEREKWA